MVSPSNPYTGSRFWSLASLSTAIILPPTCIVPTNLSGIGGTDGAVGVIGRCGGGGALSTGGTAVVVAGARPNRNKLRIGPSGFGRSASRASSFTSGAASAVCPVRAAPLGLDAAGAGAADRGQRR